MRTADDHEVVREIRDAGVRVHAAVVGRAGVARRIPILRAAVLRRIVHVAKRVAGSAWRVDVFADFPRVRIRRAGVVRVRLAGVAEDVGGRFVERARFIRVSEVRGALGDGVRQLVRVDVERFRQRNERRAVAVAVYHLRSIPERIVVA